MSSLHIAKSEVNKSLSRQPKSSVLLRAKTGSSLIRTSSTKVESKDVVPATRRRSKNSSFVYSTKGRSKLNKGKKGVSRDDFFEISIDEIHVSKEEKQPDIEFDDFDGSVYENGLKESTRHTTSTPPTSKAKHCKKKNSENGSSKTDGTDTTYQEEPEVIVGEIVDQLWQFKEQRTRANDIHFLRKTLSEKTKKANNFNLSDHLLLALDELENEESSDHLSEIPPPPPSVESVSSANLNTVFESEQNALKEEEEEKYSLIV